MCMYGPSVTQVSVIWTTRKGTLAASYCRWLCACKGHIKTTLWAVNSPLGIWLWSLMAILSLWVLIPKGVHKVHLRPSGNLSNGFRKMRPHSLSLFRWLCLNVVHPQSSGPGDIKPTLYMHPKHQYRGLSDSVGAIIYLSRLAIHVESSYCVESSSIGGKTPLNYNY